MEVVGNATEAESGLLGESGGLKDGRCRHLLEREGNSKIRHTCSLPKGGLL
jgi:hypothetical protein